MRIIVRFQEHTIIKEIWTLSPLDKHELITIIITIFGSENYFTDIEDFDFIRSQTIVFTNDDELYIDMENKTIDVIKK